MRYIAFWEMKPEDIPKVINKFKKRNEAGMENLFGHGLKTVFGPCHIGLETKGFTVLETDHAAGAGKLCQLLLPELPIKIYPINDSNQMVSSYLKYNK